MAPRGRSRRQQQPPRLTRMDAAIDAMVQFGFSEDLVRKTVKGLLKEYGGDECWAFIEGDAYKLLIETILDAQEKCGKEENLLKNDSLLEGGAGDDAMAGAAGPSGGVPALTCSEVVNTALETINTEIKDCLVPVEGDGKGKNIGLDQNCHQKEIVDVTGGVGRITRSGNSGMHLYNTQIHSSPPLLPPSPPASSLPTRRRKPCYGWISSDEDEPDDFIQLTPAIPLTSATTPRQSENVIHGTERRGRRKSRWDVRPEDMYHPSME